MSVIDADEYIFPVDDPKIVRFLPGLLQNQTIIRMPWYLMSTHGIEARNSGLIIERFTEGVMNHHIKTFVKTVLISDWKNSHYPVFSDKQMDFAAHPFVYEWEMNMSVPCPKPKVSPFFIKLFQGLSWQEYMELRGSRNRTSANEVNPW